MARNGILGLFFLLLLAADVSNASILWKLRKLMDTAPNDQTNGAQSVSPSPSPVSITGTGNPPAVHDSSSKGDPVPASANSSTTSDTDKGKNPEPKKTKTNPELTINKNCDGVLQSCAKLKLLLCISSPNDGSGNLALIVQTEGGSIFNGNLTAGSVLEALEIAEHDSSRINITSSGKITNIRIKSVNGEECVFNTSPLASEGNFLVYMPSFDYIATPINAAYLSILTVLVFGGMWACCKCRKKRQHGGFPYQELEMGQSDSISASNTIVEAAQGWDQDWGEDWDEESAVKSSGGLRVGSISANGLTARTANKDGWENDWDD